MSSLATMAPPLECWGLEGPMDLVFLSCLQRCSRGGTSVWDRCLENKHCPALGTSEKLSILETAPHILSASTGPGESVSLRALRERRNDAGMVWQACTPLVSPISLCKLRQDKAGPVNIPFGDIFVFSSVYICH